MIRDVGIDSDVDSRLRGPSRTGTAGVVEVVGATAANDNNADAENNTGLTCKNTVR